MGNITIEHAKKIAEEVARQGLESYLAYPHQKLLRDEFSEGQNCWFFFRNPEIKISKGDIIADCAYCVSKRGECRTIADFHDDPEKLANYLQIMSDYFAVRPE